MKKVISVLLAVLMLMGTFTAAASAVTKKGNEYPVIIVYGRGAYTPYYLENGKKIFPVSVETDYIIDGVKECLPYLAKGLVNGNLQPWVDRVIDFVAPLYADLIPEGDGDTVKGGPAVINGYGHPLTAAAAPYDYSFNYDWRRDSAVSAGYLNEYIQQIKQAEGCDKVSLVGRCYGANVVSTYLYDYGHDDIDTVVYYCSTAMGCYASGCLFSGEMYADPDVIESFLEGNELLDDPVIMELIRSSVAYINSFYGLEIPMQGVKLFLKKVFPALAPKLFPVCYGSMSCFWDMVDLERYEKAKSFICADGEGALSPVIAMTDRYHYEIMKNLPDMLKRYSEEGMNVGIVAKYGCDAQYPFYDNGNPQSDNTVELEYASFGATCSEYGDTLSRGYLKKADMKYVSSDNCVDASTALFKDNTWIIKNIAHSTFPVCIDNLMCGICNFDGQMTVDDNEGYPQFLDYNGSALSPLTQQPEKKSFRPVSEFISALLRLIRAVKEALKLIIK